MEVKEVGIARGNEAGFTVDGKFFVVPGIAARMDRVNNWVHLGDAVEDRPKKHAYIVRRGILFCAVMVYKFAYAGQRPNSAR